MRFFDELSDELFKTMHEYLIVYYSIERDQLDITMDSVLRDPTKYIYIGDFK